MQNKKDSAYRLRLADGFLKEAKQDLTLARWRSCVDNAQLSVENSGKTIIAAFEPVEKSHDPSFQLAKMRKENKFPSELEAEIKEAITIIGEFSAEEHFMTDYGDERLWKDPWEIFTEENAKTALMTALRAFEIAQKAYNSIFADD